VRMRTAVFILCATASLGAIVQCGGSSSPTGSPTPATAVAPTPTPTPTPTPGSGLPAGMVCDPTPPPLYGMKIGPHGGTPDRTVLDSKPLVVNVNGYCERIGESGRFCETRLEGDPQRVACDYMAVGKALDTGRWGPTWYYNNQLCDAANLGNCANHGSDQFLAVAKAQGRFEACAAPTVPVDPDGSRCGECNFNASGDCK
jgi:hypothetical protein